jgi:hypothetical protein
MVRRQLSVVSCQLSGKAESATDDGQRTTDSFLECRAGRFVLGVCASVPDRLHLPND